MRERSGEKNTKPKPKIIHVQIKIEEEFDFFSVMYDRFFCTVRWKDYHDADDDVSL